MWNRSTGPWAVTFYAVLSCGLGVFLVLAPAACQDRAVPYRAHPGTTSIPGYFSVRGLPPIKGVLTLTPGGLAFRSSAGSTVLSYATR